MIRLLKSITNTCAPTTRPMKLLRHKSKLSLTFQRRRTWNTLTWLPASLLPWYTMRLKKPNPEWRTVTVLGITSIVSDTLNSLLMLKTSRKWTLSRSCWAPRLLALTSFWLRSVSWCSRARFFSMPTLFNPLARANKILRLVGWARHGRAKPHW